MKHTLFALMIAMVLSGCSSGGKQSPNNTQDVTADKKTGSDEPLFPTPAPTPQPKVGEKTDYLHLEETIEAEGMETIQITTLTWCETVLNAEGKPYCLANEVGQIKQGAKVGYFTRRFDFQKREKGLTTNLDPSRSLWDSSSSDWDEIATLRATIPLQKAHVKADLQGYRDFLETEHRLLTDRCRGVPEWTQVRELTPARQGNLALVTGSFSDLDRKNQSIHTILELNLIDLEVRFIATLFYPSLGRDEPIAYRPELHTIETLVNYDPRLNIRLGNLIVLQSQNLRDDQLVRRFAQACDRAYNQFEHESYFKYCKFNWSSYLPLYSPAVDGQASQIFLSKMSTWRTAPAFEWRIRPRSLHEMTAAWEELPDIHRNVVPELCLASYPVH